MRSPVPRRSGKAYVHSLSESLSGGGAEGGLDGQELLERLARAAALMGREVLAHAADEARLQSSQVPRLVARVAVSAALRAEEELGRRKPRKGGSRAGDARELVRAAIHSGADRPPADPAIARLPGKGGSKARASSLDGLSALRGGSGRVEFYRITRLRADFPRCVEYLCGLASRGLLLLQASEGASCATTLAVRVEDGAPSPLESAPFSVKSLGGVRLSAAGDSGSAAGDRNSAAKEAGAGKTGQVRAVRGKSPPGEGEARSTAAKEAPAGGATHFKIRFSIGFKLVFIITATIALSVSAMIFVATLYFRQDVRTRIEEGNNQSAKLLAAQVEGRFRDLLPKTRVLISLRGLGVASGASTSLAIADFFSANPEILYVSIPGLAEFLNAAKAAEWGFDDATIRRALASERASMDEGKSAPVAMNLGPYFGRPVSGLAVPYVEGGFHGALVVMFDPSTLLASLKPEGLGFSFVVNGRGELLLHPDGQALTVKSDYSRLPVVEAMLKGGPSNGQAIYFDGGEEYLGSYRRASFASLGVVSAVPSALAFENVDAIQRRNLYIMGAVLSLAMLMTYFYSRTISRPVGALMDAAREIEEERFVIDLKPTTRDELGALTATFVEMGRGLDRGKRLKETFGKFVNKEIAERALHGELRLGGERREAIVFFSDIRGFTGISESLEPEQVVEFLNRYFTLMVGCVEQTGGIVDKFIGDAVMAVWGVPEPKGDDARAAVESALLMRRSLAEFNRGRGGRGSPVIRIGCALHMGPVLAGQIGSERRMEYTVIGDTVNLTSRIEALTKPFGVDILVSDTLREALGGGYRFEPMPLVSVKGKSQAQRVFALLGKAGDGSAPRDLAELRSRLGIAHRALDLGAVHEGEEQKYEIQGGAEA